LYNDAQYPITGQRLNNVAGSDSNGNGVDDSLEIVSEHKVFFDFAGEILKERLLAAPIFFPGGAVEYRLYFPVQRGGDAPLVYFHNGTYIENNTNMAGISTVIDYDPGSADPNIARPVRLPGSLLADGQFFEAKRFQIVTAGHDEEFGDVDNGLTDPVDPLIIYTDQDNLSNFGEGRLDGFIDRYLNP
jgi:hypothetical protein